MGESERRGEGRERGGDSRARWTKCSDSFFLSLLALSPALSLSELPREPRERDCARVNKGESPQASAVAFVARVFICPTLEKKGEEKERERRRGNDEEWSGSIVFSFT